MSEQAEQQPMVRNRARPVRPVELEGAAGQMHVRRAAYGQEAESTELIRVPVFHTAPARVRVVGSVTRNLGDYNSCRVEVMVELPCYPEQSEIQRAYEEASTMVDRMVAEELQVAVEGAAQGS